jgi:hypothetical protein
MESATPFGGSVAGVEVRSVSLLGSIAALIEIPAGLLVAAGWLVGGFPDPSGVGGLMFGAGLIMGAIPALGRLIAAAVGRSPYRRR